MDTAQQSPTVLSLCTGYGGLEIGLERVFGKIRVLANVEIESFPIANLVNKMETGQMAPAPIWSDIKTFNAKIFRGFVDILTGGYPCQPFSHAGRRKGEEDPRHLWPYITQIIEDCEPRWVFFENVEGHLSNGIVQVLRDLEWLGYKPKIGIFSATEVGAPHQRKRVFILGQRIVVNSDSRGLEGSAESKRSASVNVERSDSGQEALGNTEHDGLDGVERKIVGQSKEGGLQKSQGRCEQGLDDTVLRRYFYEKEKICSRGNSPVDASLGNSEHDGRDGIEKSGSIETSGRNGTEGKNKTSKFKGTGRPGILRHLWPARPGEEQFPWEEPRVLPEKRLENATSERSRGESGNAVHEKRRTSESRTESVSEDTKRRDDSTITDDKPTSVDGNKLADTPGRRFEQCESCGETENDISEEGERKGVANSNISQSRWKNVKKPGETSLTGLGSDSRSSGKLAESKQSGTCGCGENRTLPEHRGDEVQPNRLRATTQTDDGRNGDSRRNEKELANTKSKRERIGQQERVDREILLQERREQGIDNIESHGAELVDSEAKGFQGCGESHSEERRKHQGERREVVGGSTKSGTYGRPSGGEETSSKTQSKLGRAINGIADRVDRLRLLGNGVVPQVAEKAFMVLLKETQKKDNEDLMEDWFD